MLKQAQIVRNFKFGHLASQVIPLTSVKLVPFSSSANEHASNESSKTDQDNGHDSGGGGGGRSFLKFLGFSLVGIGGTATAFYLSSDLRETFGSLPYFKEAADMVSSRYASFFESARKPESKPSTIEEFPTKSSFTSRPPLKEIQEAPKPIVTRSAQPAPFGPIITSSGDQKINPIVETKPISTPKKTQRVDETAVAAKRLKKKEEEAAKLTHGKKREKILTDLALKTISMEQAVLSAISFQVVLETKLREHTSLLKKAMEDDGSCEISSDGKNNAWSAVFAAHEARESALTQATNAMANAESELESLKSTLDEGKDDGTLLNDHIYLGAQKQLIQMKYDLSAAHENTQKAEAESTSVEIYKDLIDKGKREFLKELDSVKHVRLLPGKDSKMTEEEWNFLIAHAHRRVEQLQRRIIEMELGQKSLIESAIALQRAKDETVFERRLLNEVERQQQEFEFEKQKMEAKVRETWEVELTEALARQASAHSDHLVHVLRVERDEQNRRFELEMRERLVREREEFRAAILKWINRVKGLEAAVAHRAKLEREGQLSQKMWLSCQNFANLVLEGDSSAELIPVEDHIALVLASSSDDPVMAKVLESVSDVAIKRGVFSLDTLGRRFRKVRSVCKRVALLDETDVSLFNLGLSWLQSLFIFEKTSIYNPKDDFNVDELDTFTILSNAEECVGRGEIDAALKYMSQLKGMPHLVAKDWIDECRLTLEVQMIAHTLLAFAGDRSARAILKTDE